MNIDEAIKHCRDKAEELRKDADYLDAPYGMDTSARTDCLECAKEHEQLADWLEELKMRREAMNDDEKVERQRFHFGRLIHPRFGEQDCIYDDARQIYYFDSVTKELMVKYGWKWEEADNDKVN